MENYENYENYRSLPTEKISWEGVSWEGDTSVGYTTMEIIYKYCFPKISFDCPYHDLPYIVVQGRKDFLYFFKNERVNTIHNGKECSGIRYNFVNVDIKDTQKIMVETGWLRHFGSTDPQRLLEEEAKVAVDSTNYRHYQTFVLHNNNVIARHPEIPNKMFFDVI